MVTKPGKLVTFQLPDRLWHQLWRQLRVQQELIPQFPVLLKVQPGIQIISRQDFWGRLGRINGQMGAVRQAFLWSKLGARLRTQQQIEVHTHLTEDLLALME